MDYQLFKIINSLAGQNTVIDYFFIFLASYLIVVLAAAAIFYIWRTGKNFTQKTWWLLQLILASGLAFLFNNLLLQQIYFRSRPFVNNHVVLLIEKSANEKSFPSDHATLAFAIATSIYLIDGKAGIVLMVLAFLIAWGRVLVGVHYPSDVLAGAAVGVLFALISKKIVQIYVAKTIAKK